MKGKLILIAMFFNTLLFSQTSDSTAIPKKLESYIP